MAGQGGGNWTGEDTLRLREAMQQFPPHTNNRYLMILQAFPEERRHDIAILQHYLEELAGEEQQFLPPQNFGAWTQEEDDLLFLGLVLYGRKWKRIARELVVTRSASQCRSRYGTQAFAGFNF